MRARPTAHRRAGCRRAAPAPERRRPAAWAVLALVTAWTALAAVAAAPPAAAHELGMFQVFGTFLRDGTYRLEIRVDDEHLPSDRLGGPARTTRYGPIRGLSGPPERRFGRFLCDLTDSLTLRFDGREVTPVVALDPPEPSPDGGIARVILRVEGWIPGGARTFTFASTLTGKPYPLVLNCEGDELSVWKWVDLGGVASPPFHLAARVVAPPAAAVARRFAASGAAAVLPRGLAALLLVALLVLVARRPLAAFLQIAGLTLAQTLGLALALSGALRAPAARIETLLALGIAALAAACLWQPRRHAGAVAGRAFAAVPSLAFLPLGALLGLGAGTAFPSPAAPASSILAGVAPPWLLPAVAGFDVGTLAAELAVAAAAVLLVGLPLGSRPWYRGRVVVPTACLIAVVGLYLSLAGIL